MNSHGMGGKALNGFSEFTAVSRKGVKLVGRPELHKALFYTRSAAEYFPALF